MFRGDGEAGQDTGTRASPARSALPERGWEWEEMLVGGRLHCIGYRGEAVLIPAPLPVYAAA